MTSQVGFRAALLPGALAFSREDYQTSEQEPSTPAEIEEPEDEGIQDGLVATLPTEVIQQIFELVDPETFASLILVNRTWRKAADAPEIYAQHLLRCPSYSGNPNSLDGPFEEEDLPRLKQKLQHEVKRSLFAPFLRPEQTTINLISTTTSSSAAFPHGEGYEFIFSHRAQYCVALSSGRIVVIDTASETPTVTHELKVVRRPLSACILADGSLLAVLAANHRVNLYDLSCNPVMFKRSVELDETAHTITMTVGGEILAAGSDSGVEVVSLAERGPQAAKRVIKCDRVDNLAFSADGTMLLGTTQASRTPSTVILTAPYFSEYSEHDMDHAELLSHLWTSQIIFPNSSRDCSHAALLPRSNDHDANWTLAYDRVFESFRAVRTDDLRNGTTYFTGPEPNSASSNQAMEQQSDQEERRRNRRSKNSFTPKSLPAITPTGELVAAPFLTSDIWLYGVPDDLEHPGIRYGTDTPVSPEGSRPSSPLRPRSEVNRMPRWQVLVDKYRNVFAKGRKVASVTGATSMSWCSDDPHSEEPRRPERLVIAAPGGVSDCTDLQEEELAVVDGGRIVVLDFVLGPKGGSTREITIEIGSTEPQLLEEENIDLDEEIATARRRTLARQSGVSRLTISSVADILRPAGLDNAPPVPPMPEGPGFGLDRSGTDETQQSEGASVTASDSIEEGVSVEEAMGGLDGPYSQSSPRSRGVVYRSAAAVEANRRRNPPNPATRGPAEFRRTDGTEVPHESDADNWVPPPPAYGKHVDDIRRSIITQESKESTEASTAANAATEGTPVSPVTAEQVTSARPEASEDVAEQSSRAARRRSADLESSRWFSRHEHNRSEPPSLGVNGGENSIQRSQSQRTVNARDTSGPVHRAPIGFAARSAAHRTALRPPTAILSPPDSSTEPSVSPLDGAPGDDTPYRHAYFQGGSSSSSQQPRSMPKALAPKQQWPMTHEDGRPVVPPKDSPRHATHPSHDSNTSVPPRMIPRKAVETSAYQSTAATLQNREPSVAESPKRRPLAPIVKLGASAATQARARSSQHQPHSHSHSQSQSQSQSQSSPQHQQQQQQQQHEPYRPSVSRSASAHGHRAQRESLEPGNTEEPVPLRKRRSLRFGRRRPKTADPSVLAAAAPMILGSSGVPPLPAMPNRSEWHSRGYSGNDLSSYGQQQQQHRGWSRGGPRPGSVPQQQQQYQSMYDAPPNTSGIGRRSSMRRVLGMSRSQPVAPAGAPIAEYPQYGGGGGLGGQPMADPGRRKSRMQGGGKCLVM